MLFLKYACAYLCFSSMQDLSLHRDFLNLMELVKIQFGKLTLASRSSYVISNLIVGSVQHSRFLLFRRPQYFLLGHLT